MSKNTVKTKTIDDLDWYDDAERMPLARVFVSPLDPETTVAPPLHQTDIDTVYTAVAEAYRPLYEQSFTGISLTGRRLYYPVICQDEGPLRSGRPSLVNWRVMFMNSKAQTTKRTYKVSDGSGVVISAASVSSEPYMTIDWPYYAQDYLSVVNAAADVDVLLRGYVGGYPDVKPYQFAGSNVTEAGGYPYDNAKRVGECAFASAMSLTDVDFPRASEIGYGAFQHCRNLSAVSLPRAWKIGSAAFSYCKNLSAVSLPQVFEVRPGAFAYCINL